MMMMRESVSSVEHLRISPTARLVAYCRSFSNIPYAEQISKVVRGEEFARQLFLDDFDVMTKYSAVLLEARYKCFDRMLKDRSSVMEFAVGTSVERGLCITSAADKMYVGTDLAEVVEGAKHIMREIGAGVRPNLHLEPVNILSYVEIVHAARHFQERRNIMIVHEGLWMHLTLDEQSTAATNIRRILARYGGTWVTPDIIDRESNEHFNHLLGPQMEPAIVRTNRTGAEITGRLVENNFFETRMCAVEFLRKAGFEVSLYPLVEDFNDLKSGLKLLDMDERGRAESALRQKFLWVMTPI